MAENRGGLSPTTFMGRSQEDATTMKVLVSNQASLDAVNVQLVRISTQMSEFSNSLTRISGLMAESSALERLKEQQQAKQERELAEQRLREGKESVVERKMQSALAAPIQKVGAKAQGTLGNLMRFFTILLSGWLLNQGIQALKAYSEGNKKRLQDIGKSVLKGLAISGAIFGSIKLGLAAATGSLLRAGSLISQAVFSGLFKRPAQALVNAVKGVKIPGTGGGTKKPPTPSAKQNPMQRAGNILSSTPGGRISAAFAGAFNLFQGKSPGESAAGAAATGLGAAALARAPLGPAKGLAALFLLPQFNKIGMEGYNLSKQYFSQNTINLPDLDVGKKVGGIGNLFSAGTDQKESHKADIVAKPMAKVSSPPKADTSAIGPEPESKPQVILTDTGADQQQQSIPTATGNITDLPPIASSNPDNFYVLYSQVHYNVVI
jgi:hypothetical protein